MNGSIPIDITRLTGLMCVSTPELKTTIEGEVRKDRDGNQLWVTGLAVRRNGTRKASVVDVQTAAEPVGVSEGTLVALTELEVSLWEIEGRHGLSWRAASIYPAKSRTNSGSPASVAGRGKSEAG